MCHITNVIQKQLGLPHIVTGKDSTKQTVFAEGMFSVGYILTPKRATELECLYGAATIDTVIIVFCFRINYGRGVKHKAGGPDAAHPGL